MVFSEGMYQDLKRFHRLRTMTAFNAMNVAPLQGEWQGTATPALLLPGRRGQLCTWFPFDEQEGNYNVAICAKSGSGKSTFTQELIVASLGLGARVWVIDAGRSYEKTCHLLGGEFLCFQADQPIGINPFSHIRDFDNEALRLLKPLVATMAHPTSSASDEEMAFIEQALKHAWQHKGRKASITSLVEWLKSQDHPVCDNLALLLYSYTKAGMFGRYFEGEATIHLDNPFMVLELQELKNKPDLQAAVLLVMMYHITQTMYLSERSQPKLCIIDEAWDLLGSRMNGAKQFIETGYRTARRFRGSFTTITQSISDYYRSDAAQAAFENSDQKILLAQTPESIHHAKTQHYLDMDPFREKIYNCLQKTDDYAECVINSPSHFSVHRIVLDPFSRILYSSKGEEFEAVKQYQKQGDSLPEAITKVAGECYSK